MNYRKTESDMEFSFPEQDTFDIEQSDLYTALSKGNGIKACDFVFLQHADTILLIEAKKSSPNPANPDSPQKVAEYTHDIHFKMIHSLFLLLGMAGLRSYHYSSTPPQWIAKAKDPTTRFIPVLVVKSLQKEWLPPISDRLRKEFAGTRKAFNLEDLIVMNEDQARAKGFIQ
jgi:hypothetical protein